MKTAYEEYLRKYHTLTYKNVGVSMLPLLKQGRDPFTVREMKQGESCKLWDVVLYIRGTDQYVLHRIIKVYEDSYDILGDNCIGIERGIKKTDVLGVMTDFTHKGKQYKTGDIGYRCSVRGTCHDCSGRSRNDNEDGRSPCGDPYYGTEVCLYPCAWWNTSGVAYLYFQKAAKEAAQADAGKGWICPYLLAGASWQSDDRQSIWHSNYDVVLEYEHIRCEYSKRNEQCIKERCPYYE